MCLNDTHKGRGVFSEVRGSKLPALPCRNGAHRQSYASNWRKTAIAAASAARPWVRTQERRSADAEGRAGVTSHTSTTVLPKLCPVNMPWNAAGKFSNPSATWVLNFMLPSESGVSSSSRISATKCSHDELR